MEAAAASIPLEGPIKIFSDKFETELYPVDANIVLIMNFNKCVERVREWLRIMQEYCSDFSSAQDLFRSI